MCNTFKQYSSQGGGGLGGFVLKEKGEPWLREVLVRERFVCFARAVGAVINPS